MKATKRILSLALALAIVLALAIPVMAVEYKNPVFTKEMPNFYTWKLGTNVLSSPATIPDGVTAELKYQWYAGPWFGRDGFLDKSSYQPIEGATSPELSVTLTVAEAINTSDLKIGRGYCLRAYYTAPDGTVKESFDYTAFSYKVTLDQIMTGLLSNMEGSTIDTSNRALVTTFKVLLLPMLLFLQLELWFGRQLAAFVM